MKERDIKRKELEKVNSEIEKAREKGRQNEKK